MPFRHGKFIAPRKLIPKQKNAPLLVLWLAIRVIKAELAAASGDWDAVIATFRQLLDERPDQRADFYEDGSKVSYSTMARDIREWIDGHGAR